jgi:C4-dicarboxylate transporter DctM subunit
VTEISALYTALTVGALVALLALGVWVGLALMGTALVAMLLFSARLPGDAMATTVFGSLSAWTLTSLPLFIWMGEILYRSRVAESMFKGLAPIMALMPGRLVQVNVGASMIFAAISGSSAATCATVGRITLPELTARKYPDRLVIGSLAGASTLGLLIPPSIIMIVYAVAADVSINKLFAAGVIPGLIFGAVLLTYNAVWAALHPGSIPADDQRMSLLDRLKAGLHLIPVLLLIACVLGSIYGGFATATESAAFGVVGALMLAVWQGCFNTSFFRDTIYGAMRITTMILLIVAGAAFLSLAMGFSGIPALVAETVSRWQLSAGHLLIALGIFFILLGCMLDGISMILLTMAIVIPMVEATGIDLIWFGIFMVFVIEIGQITPPVGFNLFVLQNATGRDIGYVSRAAFPYFLLMVLMLFVIWHWPGLVSWLPSRIGNA